jgi:Domain of unknown function (DUF4728)
MLRLDSCCCFSLRTAGKVIGFLGFLTAIITIIGDTAVLSDIDTVLANSTNYVHFDAATIKLTTQIYVSFNLALSIAHMFTSICLIVGTVQRNQVLITPWLVTQGIDIVLSLAVTLVVSIFYMINFGNVGILLLAVGSLSIGKHQMAHSSVSM